MIRTIRPFTPSPELTSPEHLKEIFNPEYQQNTLPKPDNVPGPVAEKDEDPEFVSGLNETFLSADGIEKNIEYQSTKVPGSDNAPEPAEDVDVDPKVLSDILNKNVNFKFSSGEELKQKYNQILSNNVNLKGFEP